jgi:hypothetical protein
VEGHGERLEALEGAHPPGSLEHEDRGVRAALRAEPGEQEGRREEQDPAHGPILSQAARTGDAVHASSRDAAYGAAHGGRRCSRIREGTMRSARAVAWVLGLLLALGASARAEVPPPGLTVAFLGDQGLGPSAWAVLELVRDEGADAVLHLGDFDYADQPLLWEAQIDAILGPDFPYFAVAGNHDVDAFDGRFGYQDLMRARLRRLGIAFEGDLGRQSTIRWKGLLFVLVTPDVFGPGDGFHDLYLRERLLQDLSVWRIAAWHENMRLMQVGGKGDSTGWGVYEEARRGGAIVATAHEHSYSRTHLLDRMPDAHVASVSDTLVLTRDLPWTPRDEGRTFVFVSGLGGASIRDQELEGPHWASVHTSDQGATFGALFGVFHVDGDPRRARFYFKDLRGAVVDEFTVESPDGRVSDACSDGLDNDADGRVDHDGGVGAGLPSPTPPDPECDGRPRWSREDLPPCGAGFSPALVLPALAGLPRARRAVRRRRAARAALVTPRAPTV